MNQDTFKQSGIADLHDFHFQGLIISRTSAVPASITAALSG
jgi:hypothetical protein